MSGDLGASTEERIAAVKAEAARVAAEVTAQAEAERIAAVKAEAARVAAEEAAQAEAERIAAEVAAATAKVKAEEERIAAAAAENTARAEAERAPAEERDAPAEGESRRRKKRDKEDPLANVLRGEKREPLKATATVQADVPQAFRDWMRKEMYERADKSLSQTVGLMLFCAMSDHAVSERPPEYDAIREYVIKRSQTRAD